VYSEDSKAHFLRNGIELDWVLYSDYGALVDAFVRREIAWNAPLAYRASCRINPWSMLSKAEYMAMVATHFKY
jgi:hypothetical protein